MMTVISKDGTRIAYDKSGEGPPLILVGGAMITRNFGPMTELAKLMSSNFTVFNYDRRGRCNSADTQPYFPEREVEDLEALLQLLPEGAYVYGISSGAALVIHAAAAGLSFRKIALYEPPYVGWDESALGSRNQYISSLEKLISQNKPGAVVKSFMKLVGVPAFVRWMMPMFPFWRQAVSVAHTIPYDLKLLGSQEIPIDLITKIKVPTCVMAGELSQLRLKDAAKNLARLMNQASYKELKGQRHDVSPSSQAFALKDCFLSARSGRHG